MSTLRLLVVELRREFQYIVAYRLEFVGDLLLFGLGFLLLTGLFQIVAQGNYSTRQQTLSLLGFLMWRVADGCILRLVGSVVEESQWGTMEQIWLSSVSPMTIFGMRTIVLLLFWIGRVAILAALLSVFVDVEGIDRSLIETTLIFLLSTTSAIGVAYLMIGLQLVHKQVSSLTLAFSTSLLFATGALAPITHVPLLDRLALLLPLGPGARLLQQSGSQPLLSVDGMWLFFHAVIYLTVGLYALNHGQTRARQSGSLAHY